MTHELDGQYLITTTSSYQGPLEIDADGVTEIRDGKTERRDAANCLWSSTFTLLNENEVEMVTIADPTDANADFSLMNPDGTPSLQPVTYRAILKLARKGDKIQMTGKVEDGDNVIFITLRRIES
ncbi:hypothetical protein [Micavibrio aeruginosavorus]|uniref:hypothetical protein n=1 Tax=Micavibrio aeruginosavorus TaxID=349221 RepID=UPI003F4AAB88